MRCLDCGGVCIETSGNVKFHGKVIHVGKFFKCKECGNQLFPFESALAIHEALTATTWNEDTFVTTWEEDTFSLDDPLKGVNNES